MLSTETVDWDVGVSRTLNASIDWIWSMFYPLSINIKKKRTKSNCWGGFINKDNNEEDSVNNEKVGCAQYASGAV